MNQPCAIGYISKEELLGVLAGKLRIIGIPADATLEDFALDLDRVTLKFVGPSFPVTAPGERRPLIALAARSAWREEEFNALWKMPTGESLQSGGIANFDLAISAYDDRPDAHACYAAIMPTGQPAVDPLCPICKNLASVFGCHVETDDRAICRATESIADATQPKCTCQVADLMTVGCKCGALRS